MAYIQAYSLLSDPEYINFVYICLHANYLNEILFKPTGCHTTRQLWRSKVSVWTIDGRILYSKTCFKRPFKNRQNKGLNGK